MLLGEGQRTRRPIVLLAGRWQLHPDPKILRDKNVQAEGAETEKAGGDRRIEQPGEGETVAPLEMSQIVVTRVHHGELCWLRENPSQRAEIGQGQRVDQPYLTRADTDLHEREARGIVMETVALGVEGDLPRQGQASS